MQDNNDGSDATGEEVELFDMSTGQLVIAVITSLLVMYLGAAVSNFYQLPSHQRTVTNFVFPFGAGPSAEKLHESGVKNFKQGKYRKAIQYFQRSLKKNDANAKGFFLSASSWARLGQFDKAFELMKLAKKLDSSMARIHAKESYWSLGLGRYEKAQKSAENFLEIEGLSPSNRIYGQLLLYFSLRAMGKQDKLEKVVDDFNEIDVKSSNWAHKLFTAVTHGEAKIQKSELDTGKRTEYKAWKAMLAVVNDDLEKAREHANWVLENGKPSRYEFEMIRAFGSEHL